MSLMKKLMISVLVLLTSTFLLQDFTYAIIEIQGSPEEQEEIETALDVIRGSSMTADNLFFELASRPETVVIRLGSTIDIATANTRTNEVIIDKTRLEKLKQIGQGAALDQSGLDYMIVHEALGHILNKLKGQPFGEPAAMATTNQVRVETDSSTRVRYFEIRDSKVVVPFSDGSALDPTDALRAPSAGTGSPFVSIDEFGSISLRGDLQGDGSLYLTLDQNQGPPPQLTLTFEEGFPQVVDVFNFEMSLYESIGTGFFNLEGRDFAMSFSSFSFLGNDTGTNYLRMIDESRTLAGFKATQDDSFSFELAGDFAWENAIFSNGYAQEILNGTMSSTELGYWTGAVEISGTKFAPIPEPSTMLLIGTGLVGLAGFRRRFKN